MQINMLDAKKQLPKLIKSALEGDEVIIAINGQPKVRIVPLFATTGLKNKEAWAEKLELEEVDEAFSKETDDEVSRLIS